MAYTVNTSKCSESTQMSKGATSNSANYSQIRPQVGRFTLKKKYKVEERE